MKAILTFVILWSAVSSMSAQGDAQFRLLLHPTVDLTPEWFIPAWIISTAGSHSPDNINLLAGLGYRGPGWWLEGMLQKQWNTIGRQWMINFRYRKDYGRLAIYFEPAVFLNKRAIGESAFLEWRIWHGLNAGVETENIHRWSAKDTLGFGPRISYSLPLFANWKIIPAFTYQVKWQEANLRRWYFVVNRRF